MPAPREKLITPLFIGMWVYSFVTFFSAFQLLPAIPFRILELGGGTAEAGWFLTVYTLASAFAAPVMGTIADHVGRRRTLIAASLMFIAFSLAYGVVEHRSFLLLIGGVHGAIWSAILASSAALMSEIIPDSRRTEGTAYWGMSGNAAVAIAPAVGLWVFQFGWLTLCIELAVLSALMAIAAMRIPEHGERRPTTRPTLGELWDWRVTVTALCLTVVAFGYGGTTSYVAILSLERGIEPKSLFFSVFAGMVIVIRIFTARLGDRFGPHAVLYPSLAAMPIAFAILSIAQTRWQLALSAALFGAGFGIMYPAFVTYVVRVTDPARRARTFGSIVWAFDTGLALGSLAVGTMAEHRSLGFAFAVSAGIACLAIPIFVIASRQFAGTAIASPAEHDSAAG